jgi:hypothetical protein
MRRATLAVALGGVLLTGAACDSNTGTSATAATPIPQSPMPTSPTPDYSANTQLVCDKVAGIYRDSFADFATQMGKMIANKEAKQAADADKAEKAAGAELKAIGERVRKETTAAKDPELVRAGRTAADKLVKSAGDAKFFDSIKSTKDLNAAIEDRMLDWMSPITGYCAGQPTVESGPASAPAS